MFKSTWERLFVHMCSNPHVEDSLFKSTVGEDYLFKYVQIHMKILFVQLRSNPHGEDDEEDGEEDRAHVEEEDTEQEAEERRCPKIFGSHAMSNNRKISIVEPFTTDIVVKHCIE